MNQAVTLSVDQGVALIRIDNPPVNALSPEVIDGLDAVARRGRGATRRSQAIVVIGAGRTFIAGADIKGLEQRGVGQRLRRTGDARPAAAASRTAPSRS